MTFIAKPATEHNTTLCRDGADEPHRTARILPEAFQQWTPTETELAASLPLSCYPRLRDQARDLGIMKFAGRAADPFDALAADAVVFLPRQRIEFARNLRDQSGARQAIIAAARDMNGDVIDLAAIDLDSGKAALWIGRAPMLGAENILRSRPRLESPLTAHATALSWLRANREGVFIIDGHRAADWLDGFTIAAESAEHGQRLRAALTRPAPRIVVRKAKP